MRQITKKLLIFLAIFSTLLIFASNVYAETDQEKLNRLNDEIEQYQRELNRLGTQANTLSNLISQFDTQIKLTQLKISQTEEKIILLSGRLGQLKDSLDALNIAYSERVSKTYKMSRFSEGYLLFVSLPNLNDAINSYNYLKRIEASDINFLQRLKNAQNQYENQKSEEEALQKDLEKQRITLNSQKNAKSLLLAQTKNDEKKYQSLLASAKSEMEAIQAIVSGKGVEELVGHISEGERIATIISGASCNSSGSHVHFIIADGTNIQNPFSYLRSGVSYDNCSGSSCGSSDGDSFNPSGSWNWPINERIRFFQGYGSTYAIKNSWVGQIYSFHNGIDINNESSNIVKAVRTGNLYRGSYTGSQSCRLRYVRVDHDDSNIDTYYLHINYI